MTTTTQSLEELAERCEAAAGPDRETDLDISLALDLVPPNDGKDEQASIGWIRAECGFGVWNAPEFTASIDAAKSLMPDCVMVEVYQQTGDGLNWMTKAIFGGGSFVLGYGFTEEGSRCAAALRTRASEEG